MLDALLSLKVKDIHATINGWAMSDSGGSHAVDAHFGEEGGKISRLDFGALLRRETGGAERVLDHHLPDRAESDADVLSSEWGSRDALFHFGGLLQSVSVFVVIIAIGSESHAQGAHAFCRADALDGSRGVGLGAGGEEDRRAVGGGHHGGFARWCKLPLDAIPEAFGEIESTASGV
jgi:hypothetical protein